MAMNLQSPSRQSLFPKLSNIEQRAFHGVVYKQGHKKGFDPPFKKPHGRIVLAVSFWLRRG
jgi:hypothetical protein